MEIENNTWYWISDPREGDVYYPVYVSHGAKCYQMDGKLFPLDDKNEMTFTKAIMPNES